MNEDTIIMPLHKFIPDNRLPSPLTQPLVFGDRDQINALDALEADIELMETEQAKMAGGDLKYFDVCIEYSGKQNIRVLAVDKDDAEEKAEEEADQDNANIEIDFVSVRETN